MHRYVKKQRKNADKEFDERQMTPNFAHRMVMPLALEQQLVDHVKRRAEMLSGVTVIQLRDMAYQLAEKNNLSMPEWWKRDKLAGVLSNYASNLSFSTYLR